MTTSQHRQKESRQDAGASPPAKSEKSEKPERAGESPNPVQVQKFLGGLDYPASKQALLDKAREKGADQRLLETLQRLPDRQYDSPVAVSHEVGLLD